MSIQDMRLIRLLAEKIGIKTVDELNQFKKITKAHTNEALLKRLALFVASGITFKEARQHERLFN